MKRIDMGLDEDRRIRQEWADSIKEHMASWVDRESGQSGMNRKQFADRLEAAGCKVSQQAISMWLTGQTSPRPSVQLAIAKVFGVPARSLFPLNPVAA